MGSAVSPRLLLTAAAMLATGPALASQSPPQASMPVEASAELHVEISNIRNAKGEVRICLTRAEDFLGCREDPGAVKQRVETASQPQGSATMTFADLEPGRYWMLVLHDENANGRLDRFMKIPKEGFGFSGNPKIRMGPPRGEDVVFDLPEGRSVHQVRMKYIL